jgi:hypothetical protein
LSLVTETFPSASDISDISSSALLLPNSAGNFDRRMNFLFLV